MNLMEKDKYTICGGMSTEQAEAWGPGAQGIVRWRAQKWINTSGDLRSPMKSFKQFNEVAPPGWGHTKAEKEKTDPSKPKSKIGGTAAAFKRALDRGDFKGLPGDKTKKEKTASMFKLMWSMKKKGDKPHYKPGTDKKYKKYQGRIRRCTIEKRR